MKFSSFILLVGLLVASCSKVTSDMDENSAGTGHKGRINPLQKPVFSYPHTDAFKVSGMHGQVYMAGSDCTSCHGSDLSGGTSGVSCNKCHTSYPHDNNFKDGFEHGKSYMNSLTLVTKVKAGECIGCHKDNAVNVDGVETKRKEMKSCQDCHSFPHSKGGWASTNLHGGEFNKVATKVSCVDCHSKDSGFRERNGELASCDSCHNGSNNKPSSHKLGNVILSNGNSAGDRFLKREHHGFLYLKDAKKCEACHYEGTKTKSRCDMCHTAIPHSKIDYFYENGHGLEFKENPMKCTQCHDNPKSRVKTVAKAKTCTDCHNDNSSFNTHRSGFEEREEHGFQYSAMTEKQRKLNCETCHKPGSSMDNCTECHGNGNITMPHSRSEYGDDFTMSHMDAFHDGESCLGCHDGNEKSKAESCLDCHHGEDYTDRENHVYDYIEDTESCAVCHNDESDLPTCNDCHDSSEW